MWNYGMNLQVALIQKMVDMLAKNNLPYLFTLIPAKEQLSAPETLIDNL